MKNIRCVMSAPKQELGSEFGGRSFSISVWEGRSFFPTSFPSSRLGTFRDTHSLRFFMKNIRCVVCPLPSRSLGASLGGRSLGASSGGRSFSISVWEGRSFFPTSFPSSRLGTFRDTHSLRFFMKNIRCVMSAPKQELGSEFGGAVVFQYRFGEGRSFFPTSFPSSRLGTYRNTHSLRFFMKNIRCVVCPLPSRSLGASLGGRSLGASLGGRSLGASLGGRSLGASLGGRSLGASLGGRNFSISVWEGRSFFPTSFPSSRLGTYRNTHGLRFFIKNIRCVMSAPKQELGSEFGGK